FVVRQHEVFAPGVASFFKLRVFVLVATPTLDIDTLSLHDALPIFYRILPIYIRLYDCLHAYLGLSELHFLQPNEKPCQGIFICPDRKSTRLNSSHVKISYAVFCLKKKKTTPHKPRSRTSAS